jgi:serine acetyltransferase
MTSANRPHPPTVWTPDQDWFDRPLPPNCHLGEHVFIDTAYGFAQFHSLGDPALVMDEASGAYDRTTFAVGPQGRVSVGAYTCLNGAYLMCEERISIGAHCLIAWGVVLCDHWPANGLACEQRHAAIAQAAGDPRRPLPSCGSARPIVLEDNVWVGFGAVVLPGVTLGRGCVVGCRSVVRENVPPYAVVGGDPPRHLRWLDPTDADPAARASMVTAHLRDA